MFLAVFGLKKKQYIFIEFATHLVSFKYNAFVAKTKRNANVSKA